MTNSKQSAVKEKIRVTVEEKQVKNLNSSDILWLLVGCIDIFNSSKMIFTNRSSRYQIRAVPHAVLWTKRQWTVCHDAQILHARPVPVFTSRRLMSHLQCKGAALLPLSSTNDLFSVCLVSSSGLSCNHLVFFDTNYQCSGNRESFYLQCLSQAPPR